MDSSKFVTTLSGVAAALIFAVGLISPAIAQSGETLKIRAAGSDTITGATPFFIAQKRGFFEEAKLDVTYFTIAGGAAPMTAALRTGAVDIAFGAASQYMGDIAKNIVPGKLIAEFTDNAYVIVGGKGITDPKQLKGKIFGISSYNAGDHLYAIAVLSHYGVKPDDVTWVPIGAPSGRFAALKAGKVDGIQLTLVTMPEEAKSSIIVPENGPVSFVSNAVFARSEMLEPANKEATRRFVAAMGKAADWAKAHPSEAVEYCLESGASHKSCTVAVKAATTSKNPYTWSSTLRINTDAIGSMIPVIAMVNPEAKDMTVTDFADISIAASK